MAMNINNSEVMSSNDIKRALINTFNKATEKSVQDAKYDKTILATIQYCSDATIGQYKIKYQNGYFTAYAQDTSAIYSSGASVYITIPGNDLTNRLIITGLATSDSSAKTYVTKLEGDQQYMQKGPELIRMIDKEIKLSTYIGVTNREPQIIPIYTRDSSISDLVYIGTNGENNPTSADGYIKTADNAIRFGAIFRTSIDESKRYNGDYGIRLGLRFLVNGQYEVKYYELNTLTMTGTPFNYIVAMPQYNYWEIDCSTFDRIESIVAFCKDFPQPYEPSHAPDIYITELSLHGATKLYDTNEDKYKIEIVAEQGYKFEAGTSITSLPFSAKLRVDGNEVKNVEEQGLKYFWAKEDASIKSVGDKRYNPYTGKGWRCLNDGYIKSFNQEIDPDELKDLTYVITDDTDLTNVKAFVWQENMSSIILKKSACKGRITKLKCVIVYNNTPISAVIEVYNDDGIYLMMHSSDKTEFVGGVGKTSLTIGAFKDGAGGQLINVTLPDSSSQQQSTWIDHYEWTITDNSGVEKVIPPSDSDELITIDVHGQWNSSHVVGSTHYDDEFVASDVTVNDWLEQHAGFKYCKERYDYYADKFNYYTDKLQKGESVQSYVDICERRRDEIITETNLNIDKMYSNLVENVTNRFIFGPSAVSARYKDNVTHNYSNVEITNVNNYYYSSTGGSSYQTYKDVHNTLFNLTATMVGVRATVTATAIDNTGEAVGSVSLLLQASEAANLDYSLEIVNGTQSFVYTVGGVSPASKTVPAPITIRPLYFRLYDKLGDLIYDSENADSADNQTNITELKPMWSFHTPSRSMIQTVYQGRPNCHTSPDDLTLLQLSNEAKFIYTIAESFDIKKRDESNIQLQVTYDNVTVYSSTSFTFVKEGELGTNGTNTYLDITDPNYTIYRQSVLESCYGSKIVEKENGVDVEKYYSPAERHLRNTYLYATKAYNDNGSEASSVADVKYVNLKFAKANSSNSDGVIGDTTIALYGQWYENGVKTQIDGNSKWSNVTPEEGYSSDSTYLCSTPPFNVVNHGSYANVSISPTYENPYRAYKPTTIANFTTPKGVTTNRTSNDMVRVEASKQVASQKDGEGNNITRTNYGYYAMPYFFYHNSINTPDDLDPAKHIIVVGGFDEVIYDSAGLNPEYDKEHPFKFFLFDESGENITEEFLNAIQNDSSKGLIKWTCSPGFSYSQTITAPSYSSFSYGEDLFGKYCTYENKVYKCNVSHTRPPADYNITDPDTGEPIKTIKKDEFIVNYWEEVNRFSEAKQEFKITPNTTYESIAQATLFSSWVSVYIKYNRGAKGLIEAEALIPINMICNRYGSEIINGWDGKTTQINDAYVLSSKVAAGRKYNDNAFLGVTIGENMYVDSNSRENEVGLFGYGRTDESDPNSWARTFFMDAKSGRTILGPVGASQIILDPRVQIPGGSEVWSKINGWYISPNFFYKPIGEANPLNDSSSADRRNEIFTDYAQGKSITPPTVQDGSAGMYVPWFGEVSKDDVFLWASSKVKNLDSEELAEEIREQQTNLRIQGIVFDADLNITNLDQVIAEKQAEIQPWEEALTAAQQELQRLIDEGASAEDIEAQQAVIDAIKAELQPLLDDYEDFMHDVTVYEDTVNDYRTLIGQETSGYPTDYRNFNNKKSNFYLTYGGHLHAVGGSFEGTIIANSGRFGNGSNKVSIAVTKDNEKYILYNKNFWVRDSSGDENQQSVVFIKGRIMAKEGQFGEVGDDKDGTSSSTVFIEYEWYPWKLPGDSDPWDNEHYYLDTSKGKSVKYALYHKNFHITNGGEVFYNGKLFTEEGRIGNWVITRDSLHSYDGSVSISPSSGLRLGVFTADKLGNLAGGDQWWIHADGKASFLNPNNVFKGASFTDSKGNGFVSGTGLKLAPSEVFQIGDAELTAGLDGFTFNGGVQFQRLVQFTDNMSLSAGKNFYLGDTMYLNSGSGLQFGKNGCYFNAAGNIKSKEIRCDNLIVNGVDISNIQAYIQGVISSIHPVVSINTTKDGSYVTNVNYTTYHA